jgi:helix-turn-helix protein
MKVGHNSPPESLAPRLRTNEAGTSLAPTPRLLTPDDVARMLNTSPGGVRDHATRRNPRIPVVRLGGKRAILRFRTQDIENFVNAHLSVQEGGI